MPPFRSWSAFLTARQELVAFTFNILLPLFRHPLWHDRNGQSSHTVRCTSAPPRPCWAIATLCCCLPPPCSSSHSQLEPLIPTESTDSAEQDYWYSGGRVAVVCVNGAHRLASNAGEAARICLCPVYASSVVRCRSLRNPTEARYREISTSVCVLGARSCCIIYQTTFTMSDPPFKSVLIDGVTVYLRAV